MQGVYFADVLGAVARVTGRLRGADTGQLVQRDTKSGADQKDPVEGRRGRAGKKIVERTLWDLGMISKILDGQ